MKESAIRVALSVLKGRQRYLNNQQFKTIRGQILAGDIDGAMKGLERLETEKKAELERRVIHGHQANPVQY